MAAPLRAPSSREVAGAVQRGSASETYVGGFLGLSFPSSGNVKVTGVSPPLDATSSDLDLKNSLVYGAKVGHFFGSLPWLGLEGEVFNSNPHVKQQAVTRSDIGFPVNSTGYTLRVTTLAMNVIARYPGQRFQPYAGVGLGLFFAHQNDGAPGVTGLGDSRHSRWRPGLNTQLGLKYKIDDHLGLFGEWKYNRATFSFDETANNFATKLTYEAHMLVFGISYSFPH